MLLTAEDIDDRTRYLNVRNTLLSILEFGAVPIINENDTVSVDELKDHVSATTTGWPRWSPICSGRRCW